MGLKGEGRHERGSAGATSASVIKKEEQETRREKPGRLCRRRGQGVCDIENRSCALYYNVPTV